MRGAIERLVPRLATACFAAAATVGLLGAFVGLDSTSFWIDELFTAWTIQAGRGLDQVFSRIITDVHPPLYFVILWLYSQAAGVSETALRGFSALCATFAVLISLTAARRVFSLPATLFGAALSTGSLFWFFQSQNARSYALCLLISAILMALALALLRDAGSVSRRRWIMAGLLATMLAGSFVHFYLMYEALAILCVLVLLRPRQWPVLAAFGVSLVLLSALYVRSIVTPNAQIALGGFWILGDAAWYVYVARNVAIYAFGKLGLAAIALCLAVAVVGWLWPPRGVPRNRMATQAHLLLIGVPCIIVVGGVVSSTLIAPNFSDRNFLVCAPFLWTAAAGIYDLARKSAHPPLRIAVDLALSGVAVFMSLIVVQRVSPRQEPLTWSEPFRESAEWIRSMPECRGQAIPVLTTDRKTWYRPGYAATIYAAAYGYYLRGFAVPTLVFMDDLLADAVPADLERILQERIAGGGCPILAWSVHNVSSDDIERAKRKLLEVVNTPGQSPAVAIRSFRDGRVGYVVHLEGKAK